MLTNKKIIIIGGDKRFEYLFDAFINKCKKCVLINTDTDVYISEEMLKEFDIVILPLPVTRDGIFVNSSKPNFRLPLKDVLKGIRNDALVFGGILDTESKTILNERNIRYFDYYTDTDFLVLNSHLTALGTLKLISDNTEKSYKNKNVLITGYGYLAKALCNYCDELGMNVSIIARKPKNREDAMCHGFDAYDFPIYEEVLVKFDYIFNTVPSKVFSVENIKKLKKDTVFVELASKPFGTDPEYFISFDKNYICGQSLPGKYYPKECSKGIYDAILNHLISEGDDK